LGNRPLVHRRCPSRNSAIEVQLTDAAEFFEELRREYLAEAPARLGELRKDLAALVVGEPDAAKSLKVRFHRLAGSGGSYGFPEISTVARAAEQWLAANPGPDPTGVAPLEQAIAELVSGFDRAAITLGLPALSPPAPAAFGWRALVVGPSGRERELAVETLSDVQFVVEGASLGFDPTSIPISERPDLAVLIGPGGGDLGDHVAAWALPTQGRPASVVLIAPIETIDPLVQPYASLDVIIPSDRIETELSQFARRLGRRATAPRSVLIVTPNDASTRGLQTALDGIKVRTEVVDSAAPARVALTRESWDGIVIEGRLADPTASALIRWIRHQWRYRFTPVIVVATRLDERERLEAIRAGADDAVLETTSASDLAQQLRARIDRSHSVRWEAHRDEITGLLNRDAVVDELDRAIGQARRTKESVTVVMVDLDHLRRVNEQLGHRAGDSALTHVARAMAGTVRSSDLVARMGGEEFAAVVRRCGTADAGRVAEKIRAAVGLSPVSLGEVEFPVRVSVGVACYPDHGSTGAEVIRVADRALTRAKAAGRDRVVVGE
jgi:diguanylate cyclase (GGDEF)-like protein